MAGPHAGRACLFQCHGGGPGELRLNAAIGAGGLAGGAAAAALVRVTRLGRSFIAGLLLWGLPLAVLAFALRPAVACFALVVAGFGNAVEDTGVFTLVAATVSARVARVLCAKEFVAQAGLSAGSIAAPLLLEVLGVSGTLLLLGGGLAALALAHATRFARLDRAMPPPGQEAELLRRLPTVAAEQPMRTLALDRESFLIAIAGNSASSAAADALIARRLAADGLSASP